LGFAGYPDNPNTEGERMNLAHPVSEEFAKAVDKACGRMVAAGLEREAMYWLADELASMLSSDQLKARPVIPHGEELYRLVVAIGLRLRGGEAPDRVLADRRHSSDTLVRTP